MADHTSPTVANNDEIDLIDLAVSLGEQKRILFAVPAVTTTIAIAYALIAPPVYTSQTVLLPPQQQQSAASSMLASLGSLAGLAGAAVAVKSPEAMYVAFLTNQTVENEVITRLGLQARYDDKTLSATRKDLERHLRIQADKQTGLITIDADDKDPTFSARLANTEVEALHDLLGHLAVTDAQQRRIFFATEMKRTERALANANLRFRQLSSQGGLPVTSVLAETAVKTTSALRAQITAKEVEISAMRQFATSHNVEVRRLTGQLTALQAQLYRLEQGGTKAIMPTAEGTAAISALRDLKTDQAVLEVMTKQYEVAKMDEAREGPLLQQVDIAAPPDHRSKPKRALIVALGACGGLLLGIAAALMKHAILRAKRDPETAAKLQILNSTWRIRK